MTIHARLFAAPLLLLAGGAISACIGSPGSNFPEDGSDGHRDAHGDDDDGHGSHGNPEAGDRIGYWELVRTAGFDDEDATISTRASFFEPQVLGFPAPGGPEDCFVNLEAPIEPWDPPESVLDWGAPSIELDGEDWTLEKVTGDLFWSRPLPDRTWDDLSDASLSVPASPEGNLFWDSALSTPETLVGIGSELTVDGLILEWESGDAANLVTAVVRGSDSQSGEYLVCLTADDGEYTIPAEFLEQLTLDDLTVELRRERDRDDWAVDANGQGRTRGISQLTRSLTIPDGFFDESTD